MKGENHLFKLPADIEIIAGRYQYLISECKEKRVLHLGCVDKGITEKKLLEGKFLHSLLNSVTKELWGIDIDKEGIALLRKKGFKNLVVGNVEKLNEITEIKGIKFDIIVAPEIIEHLNNPGLFLLSAKYLFSKNTLMIITTPNVHRISDLKLKLQGYEFVNPDHNFWFSFSTLNTLLRKNKYQVVKVLLYTETNIYKRIIFKPPKKFFRIYRLRKLYRKNPFLADGLIFVVKPLELS